MTITLPDSHRRWLEEQAVRDGLTVDRVLTDLIEEAWESDGTEAEILKAITGPPAQPLSQEDWKRLRDRVSKRSTSAHSS